MNPSSKPPKSGAEKPRLTYENFLSDIVKSKREQEILAMYLEVADSPTDVIGLRQRLGEEGDVVNRVAYQVQLLVEGNGEAFDPVRLEVMSRLPDMEEVPDSPLPVSVRASVEELVDPYSQTVYSSSQPPAEALPNIAKDPRAIAREFLGESTSEDRAVIWEDIFSTDRPSVRPITARLINSLVESGVTDLSDIKKVIAEESRVPLNDITRQYEPADAAFLKEVCEFAHALPNDQKNILLQIAGLDQKDSQKERELGGKHGVDFLDLNFRFVTFAKKNGRSREEAKRMLEVAHDNGYLLPSSESEVQSGVRSMGARDDQETQEQGPDTQKRRGLFARILGRKG